MTTRASTPVSAAGAVRDLILVLGTLYLVKTSLLRIDSMWTSAGPVSLLVSLGVAALCLRLSKERWSSIGLKRPESITRMLLWTVVVLVVTMGIGFAAEAAVCPSSVRLRNRCPALTSDIKIGFLIFQGTCRLTCGGWQSLGSSVLLQRSSYSAVSLSLGSNKSTALPTELPGNRGRGFSTKSLGQVKEPLTEQRLRGNSRSPALCVGAPSRRGARPRWWRRRASGSRASRRRRPARVRHPPRRADARPAAYRSRSRAVW